MSTTTFTANGSLNDRQSPSARRAAEPQSTGREQAAPATKKPASWLNFANHMATWATGGRLPLSE